MVRGRVRCAAVLVAAVGLLLGALPAAAQDYAQLIFPSGNEPRTGVQIGRHLELIYNADYAGRAERYLNDMDRARKNCDRIAYDHAKRNLEALVQGAADRSVLIAQAVSERATTVRVLFNLWRLPEDVTNLREEQRQVGEDVRALRRLANNAPRWVPCTPRTAQAPCGPPGIGRSFLELKGAVGVARTSGDATYTSTGAQAPFTGSFSNTGVPFGIGIATSGPPIELPGAYTRCVRFMFEGSLFRYPGQSFFAIPRHAGGLVTFDASPSAVIDFLLRFETPLELLNSAGMADWFFTVGLGPTFRQLNLTLRSDQSAFLGGMPSISETTWQTGFAVMAGLSTFVCPNCINGNPLRLGIEGRARFFPDQCAHLMSPVFGFTERGCTERTTDYSVLLNIGFLWR